MSKFLGVPDDVLANIMSRLPAKSFAAAACVSHLWNKVSDLILSRPRLVSGLSLAVSSEIAVNEVVEMALSKPIRPHFAIAFVGLQFSSQEIHQLILRKIGVNTILITSDAVGIIGVNSMNNELKEVKWDDQGIGGISLVIGFVPGLKIGLIPLVRNMLEEPQGVMVDKFISDVRNFTVLVSGDANPDPVGIMLFGNHCKNLKPTLAEIDKKLSRETAMICDTVSYCVCNCNDPMISSLTLDAFALVFAQDNKNREIEIKFHVGISGGIIPMNPKLEIINAWKLPTNGRRSWLLARVQGQGLPVAAPDLLRSLNASIDDELNFLYMGIKKEIIPQDGGAPIKYTEFHEVVGTHQDMLIVVGSGLKKGDICEFYHSDSKTAQGTRNGVYHRFNSLVEPPPRRAFGQLVPSTAGETEREIVFGGMLFASPNRTEKFFGEEMADFAPFCENFPGVPFGGKFSFQPIGRRAVLEEDEEEERFSMEVFNTVYLAMTYKKIA